MPKSSRHWTIFLFNPPEYGISSATTLTFAQIPTLVLLGENGEKLESLTAVKGRDIIQAANGKESVLEFNLTQAQAKKLGQTENILLEVKASTTNNQEVVVAADAKLSFDLKLVAKAVITDLDDF